MTDFDFTSNDPKPSRMSRHDLADHRKSQIEDGYLFPLHATSFGRDEVEWARVRRLNVTERAVIDALPANLRQTVFEGVKEYERIQAAAAKRTDGVGRTLEEMVQNNEKGMKAANAFAIAAFMDPRIAVTEDEALALESELARQPWDQDGPPPVWLLDQISTEDRLLLFMACMDADSNASKLFRPFRRQARRDVPDLAVVRNAAATVAFMGTEQPAETPRDR